MDKVPNYSIKQTQRYPIYLKYLISMRNAGVVNITSPLIARALKFSEEQVKKIYKLSLPRKESQILEGI